MEYLLEDLRKKIEIIQLEQGLNNLMKKPVVKKPHESVLYKNLPGM